MKIYSHDGFVGCVQRHRNRQTGTVVGVYHSAQSGIEDDPATPWTSLCEDHSNLVCHETLALARAWASDPAGWCDDCRKIQDGETPRPRHGSL